MEHQEPPSTQPSPSSSTVAWSIALGPDTAAFTAVTTACFLQRRMAFKDHVSGRGADRARRASDVQVMDSLDAGNRLHRPCDVADVEAFGGGLEEQALVPPSLARSDEHYPPKWGQIR